MNVIAADIGGTNSRLALAQGNNRQQWIEQHYRNHDFASFDHVIGTFLHEAAITNTPIDAMVLALPGPVHGDRIQLTNIDWQVDRQRLVKRLPGTDIHLINDFQAAAVGALAQPADKIVTLNPGTPRRAGPAVVTGAGTGLGLAWFARGDQACLAQATEGGHADFAPNNQLQRQLLEHLGKRYGHVSWERLLSGSGLAAIYCFIQGCDAQTIDGADVHQRALAGDNMARQAITEFIRIFGAYVGNLALMFSPSAGIYLCGGVVAKLADWFGKEAFTKGYLSKGRMRTKIEETPIYLVLGEDAGLRGAITIALNNDQLMSSQS